ncbi:bifunctional diaminohydroxyphosphoribosylaminopyrimidine deaminase/5-amino-6-(5-phosphoribosylamino)uracil reductase RibD [Planococcus sp. CAU13]|uniref:bifunctional diaminohydroxyphosphoribosylaminopyrimidine deaminase/5-amino-6-(5-phosphoribosylamino)uracil reductase RibD n=1 Tax=Planococcus sp. CAU13 TaxID=1541197 RepID=UPI0005300564|nr:bifunctional diaminohydroxyphosphoribosylaminopyrimidine deaminase/5-amino-6-(5-phosphoribosylamino)uracil reductase RibD [Planococcus sp. CAU13]
MPNHEFYMDLALNNARSMKGQTDPNPLVGSVIVNHNRIVGVGTHLKAGEPHAEIHALRMAGDEARDGTIYVTLEPCSHFGRTGPCAQAIIDAGLQKVVIAALDPNPLVAGNGVKMLRDAGIEVVTGIREKESLQMNEVFNKFITTKTPFVTLKAASTLDGKIATHTLDSKWITSDDARRDVHELRSEHTAILVGVGTVIEDDPALTARIPNGRNPIRVILDSSLRLPVNATVVVDGAAPTWIFTSRTYNQAKKEQLEQAGMRIFETAGETRTDVKDMMRLLGEEGVSSLFIEGGGTVNSAFLENHLIDKVILYYAPKLVGGKDAPTFLEGQGFSLMKDAVELVDGEFTKIGKDFKFTGYPEK